MLIIFVIYGLIAVAMLGVPYRISQRARDNAMLRDSISNIQFELNDATAATNAVELPDLNCNPQVVDYGKMFAAPLPPGRLLMAYNQLDREQCFLIVQALREHEIVKATVGKKYRLLHAKQAYVVSKSGDPENDQIQYSVSLKQWKRWAARSDRAANVEKTDILNLVSQN